jgi:tripeptide aminopeptidase
MSYPTLLERFLSYVRIDTQSSEQSETFPSTAKQRDLALRLAGELIQLGLNDASVNPWGYVLATMETNRRKKPPTIALIAHLDTSPDVSGTDVVPCIHERYDGGDISFAEGATTALKVDDNPYLREKIGKTIITSDGSTLLGADDKAGIAEIMTALTYFVEHPKTPRPAIRVVFTPDEETGRGVEHLTVEEIGADYGYTVDGEKAGDVDHETFCADSLEIKIRGVNVHPGMAKDKLVSAIKIAAQIIGKLPKGKMSPETTWKREGYVHPHQIAGNVEEAVLKFIIRDFTESGLKAKEAFLRKVVEDILSLHPKARSDIKIVESYRNMKQILDQHPIVLRMAEKAIRRSGLKSRRAIIRGGTDGARLSFMGLPTPNLFTGGNNFHSKHEWIALEDMEKATEVLIHLLQMWAKK